MSFHTNTLTSGDIVIGECRQMEIYSRIKMADFPELDLIEYSLNTFSAEAVHPVTKFPTGGSKGVKVVVVLCEWHLLL